MLQKGQILRLPDSGLVEVTEVTESRAHVRSLNKEQIKIHTTFQGEIDFSRSGRQWDISPNSSVEIISPKIEEG